MKTLVEKLFTFTKLICISKRITTPILFKAKQQIFEMISDRFVHTVLD